MKEKLLLCVEVIPSKSFLTFMEILWKRSLDICPNPVNVEKLIEMLESSFRKAACDQDAP